jgi:hypothetical protein
MALASDRLPGPVFQPAHGWDRWDRWDAPIVLRGALSG